MAVLKMCCSLLLLYSCLSVSLAYFSLNSVPVFNNTNTTVYEVYEDANISLPINPFDPITASDEEDDPIIYYTDEEGNEYVYFRIETIDSRGYLYFLNNVSLDREVQDTYTVVVYATDENNPEPPHNNITITVRLLDVNDNVPVFLNLPSSVTVVENVPIGFIFQVIAVDHDIGTNADITYSLLSAIDTFSVNSDNGVITTEEYLDRDVAQQYVLTVQATDSGVPTRSNIATLTVNVVEVTENVVLFGQLSYNATVPEDTTIGIEVLQVSANSQNNSILYSLESVPSQNLVPYFIINSTSGIISLNANLDFEFRNFFVFYAKARVGDNYITTTVEVYVTDINDSPPVFTSSFYSASVEEHYNISIPVITVTATDADGIYNMITYSIVSSSINNAFIINNNTGEVYAVVELDYETVTTYTLTLQASDNGQPTLSSTTQVSIYVQDINDNTPVWATDHYYAEIPRDVPPGTVVLRVDATDADYGANGDIRYSIVDSAKGKFDIVGNLVVVSAVLDGDYNISQYNITVLASDSGFSPRHSLALVTIDVFTMPHFLSDLYLVNISEASPVGDLVITLSVVNTDNRDLTYSIVNDSYNFFFINSTTGTVMVNTELDRETLETINITVIITIANGLFYRGTVLSVTLTDVNDNAPIFSESPYYATILENTVSGPVSLVNSNGSNTILQATDRDKQGTSFSSILYNTAPGPYSDYIDIDPSTGEVTVGSGAQFDFEARSVINVLVEATDGGGLSTNVYIIISIAETNDNPPVFTSPSYRYVMSEHMSNGVTIDAGIKAIDDDAFQGGEVKYYIISNLTLPTTMRGYFEINSTDATVNVVGNLDREVTPVIILTVIARDSSCPYHSSSAFLHVILLDYIDNHPLVNLLYQEEVHVLYNNISAGYPVLRVNATNRDVSARSLHLELVPDNYMYNYFTIDSVTGIVTTRVPLDFEHTTTSQFWIRACTPVTTFQSRCSELISIEIILVDVRMTPPQFDYTSLNVSLCDNTPVNTTVLQVLATDVSRIDPNISYQVIGNISDFLTFNTTTGRLILSTNVNFSYVKTTIDFQVQATNKRTPSLTSYCDVVIYISDCTFDELYFNQTFDEFFTSEDSAISTVVGSIESVTFNEPVQYFIVPPAHQQSLPFLILSQDSMGIISINETLDVENRYIYTLLIEAVDSASPANTAYTVITINVYGLTFGDFYANQFLIKENEANIVVGSVNAVLTGRPPITNSSIRYSLVPPVYPVWYSSYYTLNTYNGSINITKPIDIESNSVDISVLSIEINATDCSLVNSPTAVVRALIIVEPVNDNRPQFVKSSYSTTIPRNTLPGVSIGRVMATDADMQKAFVSPRLNTYKSPPIITYTIESGNNLGLFAIDSTSGMLYTVSWLNYNNRFSNYSLTVNASDNDTPSLSTSVLYEIIITDQADCVSMFNSCTNGSVQLSPISASTHLVFDYRYLTIDGPLEVCVNDEYRRVCSVSLQDTNEIVSIACRQLGFEGASSYYIGNPNSYSQLVIDSILCPDGAANLHQCLFTTNNSSCVNNTVYARCTTGLLCEGPLISLMFSITEETNGYNYTSGIPVMCNNGTIVTLCNDGSIRNRTSQEVCHYLGYDFGVLQDVSSTLFGTLPDQTLYITNVTCSPSNTTDINQCPGAAFTQCYNGGAYVLRCGSELPKHETIMVISLHELHSSTTGTVSSSSTGVSSTASAIPTPSPFPTTMAPLVCDSETDTVHSLLWSQLLAGETQTQSCPTGRLGNITRECTSDGWSAINSTACPRVVFVETSNRLTEIVSGMSNFTSQEENNAVNNAINEVNNATNNDALVSSDVVVINNIVETSIAILSRNTGHSNITKPFLETGILQVFNTLLADENVQQLEAVQTVKFGSEKLLNNIEDYGNYAGEFLKVYNDTGITVNGTFISERENLLFQVEVIEVDGLKDIIFPLTSELHTYTVNNSFSQVRIPYQHLEDRQGQGLISVINTLIKNIASYLPDSLPKNTVTGSQVISTQVVADINASDIPAVFTFTTFPFKNITNPRCVFWDYSSKPNTSRGIGQWSREGIETISIEIQTTQDGYFQIVLVANSSHITPFVVLVDVHGTELSEDEYIALEVVTYGGLTVSIIFCVLTIVVLATLKKELIVNALYLIHFNLSVALMLGYLVYIFGIDDKVIDFTNSKIGCGFVAGLLHYFFMASFCWMLCEGLMLFLQVVIVFNSFTKRWYLFLLIGWGLPLIPIAISVGLIHHEYGVVDKYCWLNFSNRVAIWAFLGPALLIVFINTVLLMLIIVALARYHKRRQQDQGQQKIQKFQIFRQTLIGALTLLPLLGITWPVSLLCFNNETTVFAWIFTILATLQGCFIFIFNVIRNEKIRTTFMKTFCTKLDKSKQQHKMKAVYAQNYVRSKNQMHQASSFSDDYYNNSFYEGIKQRRKDDQNTEGTRIQSSSNVGNNLSYVSLMPPEIQIDSSLTPTNYLTRSSYLNKQNTSYLQVPKPFR